VTCYRLHRHQYAGSLCALLRVATSCRFLFLLASALTTGALPTAGPSASAGQYIDLGISDGLALDQPRVAVEVIDNSGGSPHVLGPEFFNTFLLDTGATGVLAVGGAASELMAAGYQTDAIYLEQGVAGFTPMNLSAPYQVDFSASDFTRRTIDNVRMMANTDLNFGGFSGIMGMPAMVGRTMTMDFTTWSDQSDFYMRTQLSPTPPPDTGHHYHVPLELREFPTSGQINPEDPVPTFAPLPFAPVVMKHDGETAGGQFVVDTGAQLTIISSAVAFELGLDADGNGSFDEEKLDELEVGGIGGTVLMPILEAGTLGIQTTEGVSLEWSGMNVGVLDIDESIAGVLGMDVITSGWLEKLLLGFGPDGYLQKVHFDFQDADNLNGTMIIDVTPALDIVMGSPDPGDANGDGLVDGLDYLAWARGYEQFSGDARLGDGDFNDDGYVDGLDFIIWADAYDSFNAAAVPEPTTWLGLLIGLFIVSGFCGRMRPVARHTTCGTTQVFEGRATHYSLGSFTLILAHRRGGVRPVRSIPARCPLGRECPARAARCGCDDFGHPAGGFRRRPVYAGCVAPRRPARSLG
jgi:predicted aspartyl protease